MAPKDILDVKWRASEALGYCHDIRRRHKQKHGAWIDEATNEPGTGDPVDLRTRAGHPHSSTLTINRRKLGYWNQWKLSFSPCSEPSFQHLRRDTFISEPRSNPLAWARTFLADHDSRVATGDLSPNLLFLESKVTGGGNETRVRVELILCPKVN